MGYRVPVHSVQVHCETADEALGLAWVAARLGQQQELFPLEAAAPPEQRVACHRCGSAFRVRGTTSTQGSGRVAGHGVAGDTYAQCPVCLAVVRR